MTRSWLSSIEKLRDHPVFFSLRYGVMWSILPVGLAMVPLYYLLGSEKDWGLRVMNVYLAALGMMGPACSLLIGQFLSKAYHVKSFAGWVALAVYLSLLPFFPHTLNQVVILLNHTFVSGSFVGFFLALFLGGGVVALKIRFPRLKYGAEALGLLAGFFMIAAVQWYHFDIHRAIRVFIGNHITTADSLYAGIVIVFLTNLLWFFGLQGSAIIGSFTAGVYAQLIYDNMQAAQLGHPLPHIVTLAFFNYVFIGGAGTTILLPFFMLRSKSKRLRVLAKISLFPCFFNVNETLIYFLPLVANLELAVPFFLGPLFTVASTYYAIKWGLMPNFSYFIPGVYYLPSPLLAVVATTPGFFFPRSFLALKHLLDLVVISGSWKSGITAFVQISILGFLYYPFYRAFERSVIEQEKHTEETQKEDSDLNFNLTHPKWSEESLPS
ncbi:MAG: PTS transporter subunit EIIC [Candidatus Eremiobacteraeota bacterium]|nr:PTS transporter subunit EIIC [Candidatus Eremiobacteraeota bacterium]MCL5055636.1 PTS transporter subunit EIIC [Bacillota bacterium]